MAITGLSDAAETFGYALVRRDPVATDWDFVAWLRVPTSFVLDTPPAAGTYVYGIAQVVGASAVGFLYGDIVELSYDGVYRLMVQSVHR